MALNSRHDAQKTVAWLSIGSFVAHLVANRERGGAGHVGRARGCLEGVPRDGASGAVVVPHGALTRMDLADGRAARQRKTLARAGVKRGRSVR